MAAVAKAAGSDIERVQLAYLAVYACGYVGRGDLNRFKTLTAASSDTVFLARLSATVTDRVEVSGIRVRSWDENTVYVQHGRLRAAVARHRIREEDLAEGRTVTVEVSAILPGRLPGFVLRQGGRWPWAEPTTRLYLNIRATQAAWVLGPLAVALDRAGIPYETKVLAHPRAYLRRDAAVIYVPTSEFDRAADLVAARVAGDGIRLADPVPTLTRRLGPGIGSADEPDDIGQGQSHGQWVSGLLTAAARKCADAETIAAAVRQAIRAAGRDPAAPYLRAGRA
ncbi:hypothetical protein GCM10009556_009550 [Acrocarpospora pleiomorpha]